MDGSICSDDRSDRSELAEDGYLHRLRMGGKLPNRDVLLKFVA